MPNNAPPPVTLGQVSEGRRNNLDFLRFALATLVVLAHSFGLPGYAAHEPITLLTRGQYNGGPLAVDFFFIISGFLVTASWMHSRNPGDYLKRRCLRIYPGFLVVTLLCAFVVGPLGADSIAAYWHQFHPPRFFFNIAQLQFVLPPVFTHLKFASANGSLWTIRNEFLCYLMVAAFGLIGLYRYRGAILALFAGMLAAYIWQQYGHQGLFAGRELRVIGSIDMWPHYLAQYLAGMCFYLFRDRIPYSRSLLGLSLVVLAFSAFWLNTLQIVMPLFGAYALFYFAFNRAIPLQDFSRKGDFSYGIYLYAFPIQQLLLLYIAPRMAPPLLFLMAYPLTLGAAILSWYGVEQPFLRLKRTRSASAGEEKIAAAPPTIVVRSEGVEEPVPGAAARGSGGRGPE